MRRRRLARVALVLALLLACDQAVQWTALRDGYFFGRRIAPFDPPIFTAAQAARLAELRAAAAGDEAALARSSFDAELGWAPRPSSREGETSFDWSGSRIGFEELAREKRDGVRRVVAVGCSFTLGAEVDDRQAWPALVDRAVPDVEIANLAMGGYGVDQSLDRFLRDGRKLSPDEVWLGILPGAALRVTTLFPPLYSHWNQVLAFKPRYSLDEKGALVLVPSPASSHSDAVALLDDQRALLAAIGASDSWIARSPLAYAPSGSSWTHWLAGTRLALTWHESLGREPAAALRDANGEAYRLLRALVSRLELEARKTGTSLGVLFLPSRQDLVQVDARGEGYWQVLREELSADGIRCLDLAPAFRAAGAENDERYWMPRGHYSALANELVADAIKRAWFP